MGAATKLTVEDVKRRMDDGETLTFVDARNPQAWRDAKTMLLDAVRVPADQVADHLGAIPRDRTVITYCT